MREPRGHASQQNGGFVVCSDSPPTVFEEIGWTGFATPMLRRRHGIGIAQLTAYRVLMLWVYDRTNSLLVATLMHASPTASIGFVFAPVAATGVTSLIHGSVLAGAMWITVGALAWARSGQLSRRPLQRRMA